MNSLRTFTAALAAIALLPPSAPAAADPSRAANTVVLDEVSVKNLGIELAEAEETTFNETVFALGRIRPFPGKLAIVSTRVPGRISALLVEPDQQVEKGTELARIESRQPGDPPPTIPVVAPLAGFITQLNVVPGQPVTADDRLMEIVDLRTLHAIAEVPEHLVGKLKPGQKVQIRVPAYPDKVFESQIEHLGAMAEVEAGTLEAVCHIENPDRLLRPGMRAEFSIAVDAREDVVSLPREAVQGDGGGSFVFVSDYELKNSFVKTPVQIGSKNEHFVEIKSGLLPGDQVVTKGAYALAFAGRGSVSLREALDAAHGHPHNEDGTEMSAEQQKAADDHDHDHGGGKFGTPLTVFFAASTAVLFILLMLSLITRRRRTT